MKAKTVINAAQLLDQLYKLNDFIDRSHRDGGSPKEWETLTITFRRGQRSKSLTLRTQDTIVDIQQVVEDIRTKTIDAAVKLGVEIEDNA